MVHKYPSFAEKAVKYFLNLNDIPPVPCPVSIINPYTSEEVSHIVETFFRRYYDDSNNRIYIIGINPGRYGGGITGIPFTDPAALEKYCGISSSYAKKRELSSTFIYNLINKMGGTDKFFSRYYLTAMFPFALTSSGKNLNYYDNKILHRTLKKYISKSVCEQVTFGALPTAVSLGKRNADYLNELNSEVKLFNNIVTLEHPRYIMQYKRKLLAEYLDNYFKILSSL